MIDLEYADLEAATHAMDSWLDAFGDDPEFADETVRVRRALKAFAEILDLAKGRSMGTVRLLPPPDRKEVN